MTDWPSGIRPAPHSPCSRRKPTISGNDVAMPHSTEAIVKPMTEMMYSRFRPKRSDRKLVSATPMAAATT